MRPVVKRWTASLVSVTVGVALALSGCGSSDNNGIAPTTAPPPVDAAITAFCTDVASYLAVIDRYAGVFRQSAVTVGELQSSAGELIAARQKLEGSATQLQASIAAANKASTAAGSTTTTVLQVKTADEHIAAITTAENQFKDAVRDVDPATTVRTATAELQAAAFGLEQAYVSLFADAGCLQTNEAAVNAVDGYVKGLQQDLQTAGYYGGEIDGIYGPQTVAAVKELQAAAGLPQTGVVDGATQVALAQALKAKGVQESLNVAALQGALAAAGYYTGPIDGIWGPQMEQAVMDYQQAQQLPPTGSIDTATLAALLGLASASGSSTTTAPASTPTTSSATTTTTTA